jgi:hypothetical protein
VTNSVLARLAVQISANTAEFNKSIAATQNSLKRFVGNVSKIAGTIGVAFGVQQVANFALEISKLSGEAEGVRAAFERLPNSTKLMNDLKDATGGTVSELDLMKRAVQASNFDISLEALPRLLEFATLRAQQTGQSVDYLVDSIVTGIGRKSKLILDNLGISAVQLNEALGGVTTGVASIGDVADAVGKIAESNLSNMAAFSDNAATKIQKLEASWTNVKVAIGDAANSTGFLGGSIDAVTASLDLLASKDLTGVEKLLAFFGGASGAASAAVEDFKRRQQTIREEQEKQKQVVREVDRAFAEFNGNIDAYGKAIETHIYRTELLAEFQKRLVKEQTKNIETLETLKQKQEELNHIFEQTDANDKKKLINIGSEIIAVNRQIEAIENLRKAEKERNKFAKMDAAFFHFDKTNDFTKGDKKSSDFLKSVGLDPEEIEKRLEAAGKAVSRFGLVVRHTQQEMIDFTPMVVGAISGIGQALGSAISGSEKIGDALLRVLGSVLVQLGEMLITAGVGIEAFKKSLQSLNGAVAIAAGVALVALGAYVSGSIKGLGKNAGKGNAASFSRNDSDPSRFSGSSTIQDSNPRLVTVLKGQDIWISLENYKAGRVWTG